MNEPVVTWGGPDGRRLLACVLHELAAVAVAVAEPVAPAARAARVADGRPGAAAAAAAPRTSAAVASTASSARGQPPGTSRGSRRTEGRKPRPGPGRSLTATPPADGSDPQPAR